MIRVILIFGFLSLFVAAFTQDFDAELTTQKTSIVINNGSLTKEVYYEIRINNRGGEKYSKIAIPYSKLNKVSNIEACIKDSYGRVVKKLKKSEIITRSSISDFSFYEDDFVKEFTLKHNSYPYTIVYSYLIQQTEFLYIDYWIPVINEKVPTLNSTLQVSVPVNYSISHREKNTKDYTIDKNENTIIHQWSASYTDLIRPEEYSPPVSGLLPSVTIIPIEFSYEKVGSYKDWISYGNWQLLLLQGLDDLRDVDREKISALVKNVTDDKEKIRILYHYLQDETRYINVTIETGGLKPYPASYVAQNKYGDCKALTNYFKSLLAYINIRSYYTKVYAGSPNKEIDKGFPSQQFNHVLLYVPLKGEDIWLDCTSDGPFNHLGTFTQNRDAFIVDDSNSNFKRTPMLTPGDVLVTRRVEIKYNPNIANVKFNNTYRGDLYESILHLDKNFSVTEKARIVRNSIVADGFQLIDYQIQNANRDSFKIELQYEATSHDLFKSYGNDILLKNIAFSMPNFEKPTSRKLPVQIDYPIYKIDTLVYEIPVGYKLHKREDSFDIHNKYGKFKFNIYEKPGELIVIKSLLINPGYYPISEYECFYDFCKQVIEIENNTNLLLFK